MNGVTYINHKGPNNLFAGIVPNYDVPGTDLGSIFNVECDIVKGDTSTKGNVTFFVTPDIPGTPPTLGRTYVQVHDGGGTKLVEVDSITYEEVDVHKVDDRSTTPHTLDVKKTVLVLHDAAGNKYPLPVEVIHNGDAMTAIETLCDRTARRKTLADMQAESKSITPAQLPDPSNSVLTAGVTPTNPAIQVLAEKTPIATYSPIKKDDPRVKRFPVSRYPDRDSNPSIGTEFFITFQHKKAAPAGGTPTVLQDKVAITIDYHGQPLVTMDFGAGEQCYTLEAVGKAKPPVRDGETPATENEVIYFDVINNKGQKQRIYLPAEVVEDKDNPANSMNLESFAFMQALLQGKVELHNLDEVYTIPQVKQLSDKLMNQVFDEDRIPSGPLEYKKDDITYYYLPHDGNKDYVRMMAKDGKPGLFINLDGVVKDPSAPPPNNLFPAGSTFEVTGFDYDTSTTPNRLMVSVSDGTSIRRVTLPITSADVEASGCLCDPNPPHALYTPSDIISKNTFTTVTDKNYPNCQNKTAARTQQQRDLSGNFYYEDTGAGVKYHYISYTDSSSVEQHIQLIEKDGRLYGNFNTDPTNPSQFETCLIENIADDGTVTYIAGDPGKKFTGKLPADLATTANTAAMEDCQKLVAGSAPTRTPYSIEGYEVPTPKHEKVDKNPVAEIGTDVSPKTLGTLGTELKPETQKGPSGNLTVYTQEVKFNGSRPSPFSSGENQKLGTILDDKVLLTVTSQDPSITTQPIAIFRKKYSKQELLLSEEQVNALEAANPGIGLSSSATKVVIGGRAYYSFEMEATQLGQNVSLNDVSIKAGGQQFNVTMASQGIIVRNNTIGQTATVRQADYPLDIAVSKAFVDEALRNVGLPATSAGCRFEHIPSSPNIELPQEPLASVIYESLTKQHRDYCIAHGISPIPALTLGTAPNTVELWSMPIGKDAYNKPIYADFRVGPERYAAIPPATIGEPKVYYYGHITTEHNMETETGGKGKPMYIQLGSAFFAENVGGTEKFVVLESQLRGTDKKDTALPMVDFSSPEGAYLLKFLKTHSGGASKPLYDNTSTEERVEHIAGDDIHIYRLSPDAKSTYIDDRVAQLHRADSNDPSYAAVPQIVDPTRMSLAPIDPIADPKARDIGATKDKITKDEAPEKKPKKLWNGIKDENRKTWFALFAIATLFSVFIPFLNIIAGALLAIIAASDTSLLGDIFLSPNKYYQKQADKQGRQIEKTMNKNKDQILKYKDAIKELDDKIAKVNADTSLSPAKKSAKLAQLNTLKTQYQTAMNGLIHENERLSVDLAVHSDKRLLALKKDKVEAEDKVTRINGLLSAHPDLETNTDTIDSLLHIPAGTPRRNRASARRNLRRERNGMTTILEQQRVYLVAEKIYSGTPPYTPNDEEVKMAKKYGFDQAEYEHMRDLDTRKGTGSLSNEELETLERLKKKYGKSPFESLRDWLTETSESVDRREEEVTAMAERYAEEHPENGWRDFKFEEVTNAPQQPDATRATDYDSARANNSGRRAGSRGAYRDRDGGK